MVRSGESKESTVPGTASRFLAPDGGLVTIDAPGYDFSTPWFASVRITTQRPYAGVPSGPQLRVLDVVPAGNYDRVIDRVFKGRVVERLEAQGGQVLIAYSDVDGSGMVLWRGRWHEVVTGAPAVDAGPRSYALSRFDRLVFTDSPLGLTIEVQSPPVEVLEVTEIVKRVPGVGFLDISKAGSAEPVPEWAGARVRTGEVWRRELLPESDGAVNHLLLHATATTVTELSGEGDDRNREEPRLEFLDNLVELSWSSR